MDIFERWPATADNPNGFARAPIPEITEYKSYSRIKQFLKSPKHYHWRYILGNRETDTPAKDEGKLIHKCLLETDEFLNHLKVPPHKSGFDLVTTADLLAEAGRLGLSLPKSSVKGKIIESLKAKEPGIVSRIYDCAMADFNSKSTEKDLIVTEDQATRFVEILKSVQSNEAAALALQAGHPEVIAYWQDPEFNVTWMCAIDYLRIGKKGLWVTDVKSTKCASPQEFPKDVYNFSYYIQNWLYQRVLEGITGLPVHILQVVVEKSPPFVCEVYEPDERTNETAYWQMLRLMERWKKCELTNVWPGYTDGRVRPIGLPNFGYWAIEESADRE